ncbi:hypothetical protein [Cellulomonas pakistanensis]|uniref:Uncharacterized protein n=1 Tax=Cellulomonas pakistanensis TaxID=992287 RepID=A0A919P7L8_9CELL|nr:hypothetical protein [Cellulomonas pakistanensis]GIG35849.1 hypothetical protein Cpa01nite_12300 [Cellulomonas pakistanensis]
MTPRRSSLVVSLLALAAGAALGVLAVVGLRAWSAGPGPGTAELAAEAVVVPPVAAVTLGREDLEPRRGLLGDPDERGLVRVAYEVDLPPDQAIAAWVSAYGPQYGLRTSPVPLDGKLLATGFAGERFVVVLAGPDVSVPPGGAGPRERGFAAPAGGTVVTVEVGTLDAAP